MRARTHTQISWEITKVTETETTDGFCGVILHELGHGGSQDQKCQLQWIAKIAIQLWCHDLPQPDLLEMALYQ